MNALVTGGAGFIGSHLVDALVARGDRVWAIDLFDDFYPPERKRANLVRAEASGRVTVVDGDVNVEADLDRALEGRPEVVYHMAARAGVRPSIADPALYARLNVEATAHLLDAARKAGVRRLVFASSSSVYGASSKAPFSEDQKVDRPLSPYAASKIAAEALCAAFRHLYPMEIVAIRFFTVFGPRQRPDLAIAKFVRLLRHGDPVPFFGDGQSARDYTYVDDTVRGVLAAGDRAWPAYEVVNLGGSSPVKLVDLLAAVEKATGKRAVLDRQPDQPGDVPLTYADIGKAGRLLDWRPEVPLAEGLSRYVAWLESDEGALWR